MHMLASVLVEDILITSYEKIVQSVISTNINPSYWTKLHNPLVYTEYMNSVCSHTDDYSTLFLISLKIAIKFVKISK